VVFTSAGSLWQEYIMLDYLQYFIAVLASRAKGQHGSGEECLDLSIRSTHDFQTYSALLHSCWEESEYDAWIKWWEESEQDEWSERDGVESYDSVSVFSLTEDSSSYEWAEELQERMERESMRLYRSTFSHVASPEPRRWWRKTLPAWKMDYYQIPEAGRLRLGFGQRKMDSYGHKKRSKGRRRVESLCRQDDPAADPDFVLECGCAPEDRCDCPV